MDKIVDLKLIRQEKEDRLITFAAQHIGELHYFVNRKVNIREKVKAKHIFRNKNSIKTIEFTDDQELLFRDWFTFDYLTLKGLTIYQSYVSSQASKLHPLHSVIHALFMACVLEPFRVIKVDNDHIHAEKLLTKEVVEINIKLLNKSRDMKEKENIFIRTIPIYDQLLCISEVYVQRDKEVISRLLKDIEKSEENWRTFLKKYSIKYTWV
ncbi:hypothetical protein JOC75_004177 [Metabacillus crassostreae]|uniref:hypothetical protein n=1 Tax=Metabacillus crassostreae TaxID=929098 RepID=UPI00195993EB|nr:hypothetical protein [Metabacillus crassostreae]MBM7606147.1 hypothetical protein [Metabacillus crassostreae]